MRRGGDTPGPKTLFAIEIEGNSYITFYIQDGILYANTEVGSSSIWECNANGVIFDTISYALNARAPILAKINEHFSTSFTEWSDNEIELDMGESIPDWEDYEKITM